MLDVNRQEMNEWAVALGAKNGMARENARAHLVEMGSAATTVLQDLFNDRRKSPREVGRWSPPVFRAGSPPHGGRWPRWPLRRRPPTPRPGPRSVP